ncbi:MAG: accB [Clostridiales bacterium]|jgi:acetyl-CoA carboxylase biotin carboxyl carrier protein|nr:accB [Clostridiales bacterium]
MDTQIVKDLIQEFKAADLTKLSLKCEGFEICFEKEGKNAQIATQVANKVEVQDNNGQICVKETIKEEIKDTDKKYITSPMVGTFYASSTPNGKPFVSVGSKIKKGDPICIIEAMKLMNELQAEVDGEILEVLIKNDEMVEFGQQLFVIG